MVTPGIHIPPAIHRAFRLLPLLLPVAVCAQEAATVPEATLAPTQGATIAVDTIWEARQHWSQEGYGTSLAGTRQADGCRVFEVHAPGRSAVWWRPFDQPVALSSFPLVRLRLKATGLSSESQGFLVSLLLSDPKGGVPRMRGILSPDELLDAKSWETRTVDLRDLGEFEAVLGIKVEFWADAQGPSPAALALQPIAFLADGTPPADPSPSAAVAFVVRDRAGSPISGCQVAIDYENLNARVSGTTDRAGQVVLRSRIAAANHTATLAAPGFLPVEMAGLDTTAPNEVSLIPAMAVQGTLRCEGQPVPGIVHFDTKVPRAVVGRFPRALSVATDASGRWQAAVPAQAYAWLIRAGSGHGGMAEVELADAQMVSRWCGFVDLPREGDQKAWQAQTPDWTLREGDNDAITSIAGDPGEPVNRRARAMAGLNALIAAEPDAAAYYQLDLAWIGSRADSSLFADQAVQALLVALRRSGTRPDQAAARLRELSGGTLPMPLRQRLDGQAGSWEEAIGQVESDRGAMLARSAPRSRTAGGKGTIDLALPWSSRRMTPSDTPVAPRAAVSATGGIDLANPRHSQGTDLLPAQETRGMQQRGATDLSPTARETRKTSMALPEPSDTPRSNVQIPVARGTADVGTTFLPTVARDLRDTPPPSLPPLAGDSRTGEIPLPQPPLAGDSRTGEIPLPQPPLGQGPVALLSAAATLEGALVLPEPGTNHSASNDHALGEPIAIPSLPERDRQITLGATSQREGSESTPLAPLARSTRGIVEIAVGSPGSPGAVQVEPEASHVPTSSGLLLGPATEARSTAAETWLVRQQSAVIAALVQQGKTAEARTQTLGLLGRVTTRSAIFDCLPLLALTSSGDGNADHKAVFDCLDALAKSSPRTQANAYVAGLLHCYRCGDAEFAQEIQTRYRRQFPDAKPDPTVLLASSLCLVRQGQREEAYTHLVTIVRDFPKTPEAPRAALLLGWIELSRQKYPEAKALLEDLVRTYPHDPCAGKAKLILRQLPQVAP